MSAGTVSVRQRSRGPYVALLAAQITSETGNQFTFLAVPWFVLETTGSAGRTGLAVFVATLPMLFTVFGGVYVDRFGYRRTSVTSDLASACTVAAIPALFLTTGLSFGVLLVLLFVRWTFAMPPDTARQALLPELAAGADVSLDRAVSIQEALRRGAKLAGAPLGGVLIVAFGTTTLLWIDAATFLAAAVLIRFGVPAQRSKHSQEEGNFRARLREGFAFLLRDRLVRAITGMVMLTNGLNWGLTSVYLPLYARNVVGDVRAFGLLSGVVAAGAVTGSLLFGVVGHRMPRRRTYAFAFLIAGPPPLFALTVEPGILLMVVVMAASGLAAGVLNPIIHAAQYRRIPEALRGRVLGAASAGCFAAIPIGGLAAGLLAETIGYRPAVALFAAAYLLACLPPFLTPAWRALDHR